MASKKRIVFIMNPISGTIRKSGIYQIINDTIDKHFYDFSIMETRYRGHATEIAENAKKDNVDVVVAVGGDGTVNEVARAITQSGTALGILPCGSGNGLARHLMLPLDLYKAVEIINAHEIHSLDYGIINNIPFFCTCGMGFDAVVSQKFADAGRRGVRTYLENIFREGFKYKSEIYDIESENDRNSYRAFLVTCANASQYGNNAYIAPHASMSDGLLDVIIIEPFDVIDATQVGLDMLNKTLDKNPKVKTLRAKSLHIHREKPGLIHYDGDPTTTGADIDISIVNKGINIVVNPNADKARRQPNAVQNAFSELLGDISNVRTDITKQSKHIQTLIRYYLGG
ncbi:MAG: YegS/Rv2252/BmrU family lipid kinase [Prevotella sp.]|nr:YegS/Rv2252/BmrU family lipid kinase [Prevotella sp.]